MHKFSFIAFSVVVALASCSPGNYKAYKAENVSLDSTFKTDALEDVIAPYRKDVEAEMGGQIGTALTTLVKFAPESPLGNFAADVVFEKGITLQPPGISELSSTNTIALLNFGGLRAPISKGGITVGNVYELMPFDNTITIVALTPTKVRELCTYLTTVNGQPVSNAVFNLGKQNELTIGDEPYAFNSTVYIITSNYLAEGGDKMTFFKNAALKWDSGILMRDAFIEYIKEKKQLHDFEVEGRIKITAP